MTRKPRRFIFHAIGPLWSTFSAQSAGDYSLRCWKGIGRGSARSGQRRLHLPIMKIRKEGRFRRRVWDWKLTRKFGACGTHRDGMAAMPEWELTTNKLRTQLISHFCRFTRLSAIFFGFVILCTDNLDAERLMWQVILPLSTISLTMHLQHARKSYINTRYSASDGAV
jgi:hypothetical protein